MATARLIPSTYALSSTTYLAITNPNNLYDNTDSTAYATIQNKQSGTSSYYLYIRGFNFDAIPSNATINSFTIKFKAYESGVSTSSSYRPYICNNTTTLTCSCSTIGTSAQTISFTGISASWDTIKGYGSNFGIRINCRRASRNTTGYMYVYGAEILVDYTVANIYNVNISCTNGTSDPTGAVEIEEGQSLTINSYPDDGHELLSMTVNGGIVSPTELTSAGIENGITLLHFDGNSNDELGNSNINNSGSFSTTSKFGTNAVQLNGSQYITINLPQTYSPITVECWFNCTQANASGKYPTLFSTNTTAGSGGTYMHIDDGSYSTTTVCRSNAAGGSDNNGGYGSTTITRNTWHHFAYCRNGSSHLFFIDGQLEYTVTQSSADSIDTIYLGTLMRSSGVDTACYMTGYIDEVLVSSVCKWTSSFTPKQTQYDSSEVTYYTYTIEDINSDTNVEIIFIEISQGTGIYIKKNGVNIEVASIYKKTNGSYVLETDIQSIKAYLQENNIKYEI